MYPMSTLFDTVLPMVIVFTTFYLLVKMSLDYATRKKLIDKGASEDDIKAILQATTSGNGKPSSLKWGLILALVGLSLVVLRIFGEDIPGEVALGVTLIAAGGGLLIFYLVTSTKAKNP